MQLRGPRNLKLVIFLHHSPLPTRCKPKLCQIPLPYEQNLGWRALVVRSPLGFTITWNRRDSRRPPARTRVLIDQVIDNPFETLNEEWTRW